MLTAKQFSVSAKGTDAPAVAARPVIPSKDGLIQSSTKEMYPSACTITGRRTNPAICRACMRICPFSKRNKAMESRIEEGYRQVALDKLQELAEVLKGLEIINLDSSELADVYLRLQDVTAAISEYFNCRYRS